MNGRRLIGLVALLWLVGFVPAASAGIIVPESISFTAGGESGTIDFLGHSIGLPSGGVVLDGSVGASDDVLIFTVSLTSGEVRDFTFEFLTLSSTAAGVIQVGDVDMERVNPLAPGYEFEFRPDALLGGQTSNPFFVSFSSLTDGASLDFVLNFKNGGPAEGSMTVTLAPEPSTALLLGLGLACVSGLARARRRKGL